MPYTILTHCTLCLNRGVVRFSPKSVLSRIQNGALQQQISRISTSRGWYNSSPLTSQAISKKKAKPPEDTRIWKETPSVDRFKNASQYCLLLSKSRLTGLVVLTSMAGYAMAPAPFEPLTFVACAAGTGLVSAAANSLNQFYEVPFDAQMNRTKNRVLVKGLLQGWHAVGFACASGAAGVALLWGGVNGVTAALGAVNLLLYTALYTPLKRVSILNTWLGSVVGAIPPVMGYAGCAGGVDGGALALAALLYCWQFPHFNALSWNLRGDYSRAGYRMMAVTDPALCRRVALRHTVLILCLSAAAPWLGLTNGWFALQAAPLNAYFTYLAWRFYKDSDSGSSRKLFRFSLVHLPALLLLLLLNKKQWGLASSAGAPTGEPDQAKQSAVITVLPRPPVVAAQDSSDATLDL